MLDDSLLLAQQALRLSTAYDWLMLLSRVLHILGAIILLGGLFYLWAVVTPTSAPPGTAPVDQYFGGRRATWARWIGAASALLLVTGLWYFISMIKTYELATSYHMLGGIKILLGLALMMLAALVAGRTSAADAIRAKWRMWLSVSLVLGVLVVSLGSVMRLYHMPRPNKNIEAANGPTLINP
jgi:uncharacterized membrane protein